MEWATKVEELLQRGLYVNNLRKIEDVAWEEKGGQSKLPPYIVYKISSGLANRWDEIPLPVAEQKRVEDALLPPMRSVLSNAPQDEIVAFIEALIKKQVETFNP
jgi:hypothetical protein